MIKLAILSVIAVAVTAAPAVDNPVPILNQESEVDYTGKFHFSYESGDGSIVHENGELKAIDKDHAGEVVQGDFQYTGDDGHTYKVTYTADENGYHPQGDHIPAVPPLIAKAQAYLATAPPPKDEKF